MSQAKNVLIIFDDNNSLKDTPSANELGELIKALEGLGARVRLREFDKRYDEILDEIEHADTLFFWN
jgi:hypothetical protein